MYDDVNLNELINAYWKENECEPFSASETALFFFLLWRAGMKDWEIPFKCSTSYISRSIKISRQSVIAARESLYRRGLIYFTEGNIHGDVPKYLVTTNPDEWKETFIPRSKNNDSNIPSRMTKGLKEGLTVPLTENKTDTLTTCLTSSFADDLTRDLNINNGQNKRINTSQNDSTLDKSSEKNSGEKNNPVLSIDELEKILMQDEKWQSSVLSLLSNQFPISIEEIKSNITLFFRNQRYQGKDSREENDCRNHFYYWLRKQLEQKGKTIYKVNADSTIPDKND